MASKESADNVVDLSALMQKITGSLVDASAGLREEFTTGRGKDLPYVYHIPSMDVTVKLGFRYSSGEEKVKGILFWKRTEKSTDEQEVLSSITLRVAALPRAD